MTTELDPMEALEFETKRLDLEEKAAESVVRTRAKLVMSKGRTNEQAAQFVFFATLAFKLKFQHCWAIPTAAVDGVRMVYNPEFWMSLSEMEKKAVMVHEILHCALAHHARQGDRNAERFNIACDLAINPIVRDAGLQLPKFVVWPKDFKLEEGKHAEYYYAKLPREDGLGDGPKGDTGGCGAVQPTGSGDGDGDGQGGHGGDPAAMAQAEADWQVAVAQAAEMARQKGNLPGHLKRFVGDIVSPAADWRAVLREFVSPLGRNDFTIIPPNRRYVWQDIYLPSLRSDELGCVVAAFDWSGSVSDQLANVFANELTAAVSVYPLAKLVILHHDAAINCVQEWSTHDGPLKLQAGNRGGTSHIPVFEYIKEHELDPVCFIGLTDLYSAFPDEPDYPVLWVAPKDNHGGAPWGRIVEVPEGA